MFVNEKSAHTTQQQKNEIEAKTERKRKKNKISMSGGDSGHSAQRIKYNTQNCYPVYRCHTLHQEPIRCVLYKHLTFN